MPLASLAALVMPGVVAMFPAVPEGPGVAPSPALSWEVSTRAQAENHSPPRVLWVPQVDGFGPPRHAHATQRTIWTCTTTVALVVWALSTDQVEAIREALLSELERITGGSVQIIAGKWGSERAQLDLGESYELHIAFAIPQRALPVPATTTVTSAAVSGVTIP